MPRRKSLRSQLYRGARDLGNLEAAVAIERKAMTRWGLQDGNPSCLLRNYDGSKVEMTSYAAPLFLGLVDTEVFGGIG